LISGDIEGFAKGQAAAGAGAALRSGSSGLTSLFSASALGAGLKSLEGQGLSDKENRRAEDLTLSRVGIQSTGVLSDTTSEQQALKAEGRDLASTLGDVAGANAQLDVSEIAIKEATIIASNVVFQNKIGEVAGRNENFSGPIQTRANGGMIYASQGKFIPRGTDTVPAMLTPGEFVVNRSSVQRGNNLQLLQAMNKGGASSPTHMSGGGKVSYFSNGGRAEGGGGGSSDFDMFSAAIPALKNVFADFSSAVDKLISSQFSVKLDTTNVNVNFNGGSFLASMKEDIKSELLKEVATQISKAKPNSNGTLGVTPTVL
jgi:hypothetical protein